MTGIFDNLQSVLDLEQLSHLTDELQGGFNSFASMGGDFLDGAISSITDVNIGTMLADPSGGLILVDMAANSPLGNLISQATGQDLGAATDNIADAANPEQVLEVASEAGSTMTRELSSLGNNVMNALNEPLERLGNLATDQLDNLNDTITGNVSDLVSALKPVGVVIIAGIGGYLAISFNKKQATKSKRKDNQPQIPYLR